MWSARAWTATVERQRQGTDYKLGSVLGRIAKGAVTAAVQTGGNTGDGTLTLASPDSDATAKPGVYEVRPAVVAKAALVLDASVDDAAKIAAKHAQLVAAGIVPRETA